MPQSRDWGELFLRKGRLNLNNVIVQLGYTTKGGGIVPLAASRNATLARLVANQILGELSRKKFGDEILDTLADQERSHLARVISILGIKADDGDNR